MADALIIIAEGGKAHKTQCVLCRKRRNNPTVAGSIPAESTFIITYSMPKNNQDEWDKQYLKEKNAERDLAIDNAIAHIIESKACTKC